MNFRQSVLKRDQAEYVRTRVHEILDKKEAGKFTEITGDEHAILYLSKSVQDWHLRWNKMRQKKQVVVMSDDIRGLFQDYRTIVDRLNKLRFVLMEFGLKDPKDPEDVRKWLLEKGLEVPHDRNNGST